MICLKLNWFFYGLSHKLQFSQFVRGLRSSVWDVLNNFLLIYATDRNKISSDQKRFFIALSLYPLSFFASTPFKQFFYSYSPRQERFIPQLIQLYDLLASLVWILGMRFYTGLETRNWFFVTISDFLILVYLQPPSR